MLGGKDIHKREREAGAKQGLWVQKLNLSVCLRLACDVGRDVDGFDVGFGVGWDVVGFDVTTLQARAGVFSAAYS